MEGLPHVEGHDEILRLAKSVTWVQGVGALLRIDKDIGTDYRLLGPPFAWMERRRSHADLEKLRDILELTTGTQ
jgi:hypothetical protein